MVTFTIQWEAPEFEYREKTVSWYWITIIIAAFIIAFSVWEKNFLFGFFIIVAEVLVIAWGNEKPRVLAFVLNQDSLSIGEHKSYLLREFESWSTDTLGDGFAEFQFNFKARVKIPIKFMAPEEKLEDIRANLKTLMKEVEHQPSFVETIEKLLRF